MICLWGSIPHAAAQSNYPVRALRMVVPYANGNLGDLVTRIVAQEIAYGLGQTLLVDYRQGANGITGMDIVAKANADGYTIGTVTAAHAFNQTLVARLPYHAVNSFDAVSLLATAPLIVCVGNALAAKDIGALVALAKARPGTLGFASDGVGTASHLMTELLMSTTGARLNHVPYQGAAPALQDLLGGRIPIMVDTAATLLPYARAGQIRALGITAEKRAAAAPEMPTLIESGINVSGGNWVGWLMPSGTPKAVIERLSAEIMPALKREELRERMVRLGVEPVGSTPAEFSRFLKAEVDKWGKVIRQAGIRREG